MQAKKKEYIALFVTQRLILCAVKIYDFKSSQKAVKIYDFKTAVFLSQPSVSLVVKIWDFNNKGNRRHIGDNIVLPFS